MSTIRAMSGPTASRMTRMRSTSWAGVKAVDGHLGFDLPKALLDQRNRRALDLVERGGAHEGAARIGGHAVAQSAQQTRQRSIGGLAADVPQRDIDRRQAKLTMPPGPHAAEAARSLLITCSPRSGSSPLMSSPKSSTAALSARMIFPRTR